MDQPLTPAEALALAGRATAAAERPILLPDWYGPGIGAVFLAQALVVGAALQFELEWLQILGCAMAGPLVGALAGVASRSGGVAQRPRPGVVRLALVAVLVIATVELGLGALGWWAGLPLTLVGLIAGGAAGGVFWLAMLRVNRQIRREREGSR
ncbi:hypothetical protein ACIRPK_05405 [Kitasatospora sp. NPDC101801]|uniref:hypothetical protein n=1 Tax=Kitasatospora sp. NPDC101801 TaxID=3364103 RepID=UPI003818416D